MCLPYRFRNPRTRLMMVIANLSLVLGLAPWIFREYIHVNHLPLDAFCGFFLGLSITVNLFCLRTARRCPDRN